MKTPRTVTAEATIIAVTRKQAREKGYGEFAKFFGDDIFVVTSESYAADYVTMTGDILSWRCRFTAEAPA